MTTNLNLNIIYLNQIHILLIKILIEVYMKRIRDPIYGYIDVNEKQLEIIKLPVFQRLRRVYQLSFSDLVYPNATHTRFSHSLGVMHLGQIAIKYLNGSELGKYLSLEEIDYEALEFASLLHDIGHLPFSHVSEPAFSYFLENQTSWKDYHIRRGIELIKDDNIGIIGILGKEIIEKIINLLDTSNTENHKILKDIISGVCSIDRLDYLKRDAYHAGTPEYAIIDYERILSSITYYPIDPNLSPVFKEKSLYVLEGAILSYFYMYRAMYYHHAVRAAYLLFQSIIWEAFEKYGFKEVIKEYYEADKWKLFDDYKFISLLYSIQELREKINMLIFRELPKRIIGVSELNIERIAHFINKNYQNNYSNKVRMEENITNKLKKKFSEIKMIFFDSPTVIPYPVSSFASGAIYIWDDNIEHEPERLERRAPYLKTLPDSSKEQYAIRIYIYPTNLRNDSSFVNYLNELIREEFK